MKKRLILILSLFVLSACEYKDSPFAEMTYNGVYEKSVDIKDKDIQSRLLKICDNLSCRVLSNRLYDKPGGGFMLIIKVNKNEEITFVKDSRDIVFFMITQRKREKFEKITLDILKKSKNIGFEFKLTNLEEWVCHGNHLSYENCTRKDTKYNNLDYIEFVKSNLSKK